VKTIRHKRTQVVVGADDPSLTPDAGLVLVAEVDRILGVAGAIDGSMRLSGEQRFGCVVVEAASAR
jgi:hypothetical protein